MKTFTTHSSALLFQKYEDLSAEDHHGWRCIYMQLNDKQERFNATLRVNFINRAIIELLEKDDGYIYFCDDGDIVILFEGALKPIVARLSRHFGDLDPDQLRGQPEDNLFSFFDLSKHWEGFSELCMAKTTRKTPKHERLLAHVAARSGRRPESASA